MLSISIVVAFITPAILGSERSELILGLERFGFGRSDQGGKIIPQNTDAKIVPAEFVRYKIGQRDPKFCLFDSAYLAKNYTDLYEEEHIKDAQHFDTEKVVTKTTTQRRNLVHPLQFQIYARQLGIDDDCHVVLYDHGETYNSLITATFVWWLFKVYGHTKVSVMNGGLPEWKAKQYETDSGPSANKKEGNFVAKWDPKWIVTFDDVMLNFQKSVYNLVDSRKLVDFTGERKHKLAATAGRIKGAISLPTDHILNKDGSLKSVAELKEIFKNQGLKKEQPYIVYCNTSMQASAMYFAMVQCGYDAKMYDGSWVEWSHRAPDNLKETG